MSFQMTYFSKYSKKIKVIKNNSTVIISDIDDDTYNAVIQTRFSDNDALEKIDKILNIFNTKKLPFSWWTGPNDTPKNLKEILKSKDFHPKENNYGMYLWLENFKTEKPKNLKMLHIPRIQLATIP